MRQVQGSIHDDLMLYGNRSYVYSASDLNVCSSSLYHYLGCSVRAIMGWVYNATPEVEAESQYRLILGVCLSLTMLMVITVSLRLFVRGQSGRLAAADWVMAGSMVSLPMQNTRNNTSYSEADIQHYL
jgi:hypothetical protein